MKISKEKSKVEYLRTELLLIIFEYLYCHDIIYAFNKLNARFQSSVNYNSKTKKKVWQVYKRVKTKYEIEVVLLYQQATNILLKKDKDEKTKVSNDDTNPL